MNEYGAYLDRMVDGWSSGSMRTGSCRVWKLGPPSLVRPSFPTFPVSLRFFFLSFFLFSQPRNVNCELFTMQSIRPWALSRSLEGLRFR